MKRKMKRKIAAFLCAVSTFSTAALPAVYAAEPASTSNISIITEINGQGTVTTYDGDKLVTDTYTAINQALNPALNPTKKPDSNIDTDKFDFNTDKFTSIQPEADVTAAMSAAESAIYDSYFFQLIKKFVIQCMDEYRNDSNITATPSPKPKAKPTAAPAQTAEPESTDEPQSTAAPVPAQ